VPHLMSSRHLFLILFIRSGTSIPNHHRSEIDVRMGDSKELDLLAYFGRPTIPAHYLANLFTWTSAEDLLVTRLSRPGILQKQDTGRGTNRQSRKKISSLHDPSATFASVLLCAIQVLRDRAITPFV